MFKDMEQVCKILGNSSLLEHNVCQEMGERRWDEEESVKLG